MSILIDTSILPSRTSVPHVPLWAVPRTRLGNRLDAGTTGPLTVISAPAGAGKTIGVASWARNLHPSVGVIWVRLRKGSTDGLPLDQISAELDKLGEVVVVCDDFPAEPSASLVQDLEVLFSRADRQLSIVLICSAPPVVPLHRQVGPAHLTTINFDDLAMDQDEIRLVLDQHGVTASEATIRAVLEHTAGWAAGVSLAATALAQLSRSTPWAVECADRKAARWHTDSESGRPATFFSSMPEPDTAPLDHWRGAVTAYDGMFVVPLTSRETDVLRLLAQLCSNEEIAADLVLSLNTVKTHMRSLFQKLSVSRRADAVRRGRALGLC
ncbi:MAG TPA: LuxR C-terminal-related transcriptional regulator [Propionibacteriaceae bacterium]|nr:LuxR C-terminal-related transcriptional regulator [Propionibacteriaceae bacterium]